MPLLCHSVEKVVVFHQDPLRGLLGRLQESPDLFVQHARGVFRHGHVAVGAADSVDRQQKDREQIRFRREVAEMRRKIQTLAGCVTPMGRQMDEVQIAVDVMVQART